MKLVLATRNRHKIGEIRAMLDAPGWELLGAGDWPSAPEVEETGATFEANAILKAEALARVSGTWAMADDSGLEVDALRGAPGVFSARYAGAGATDAEHVAKLLAAMEGVSDRRARFRCVLALAAPDFPTRTLSADCAGRIAPESRGTHGFGYDPVFIPEGRDRTFGELGPDVKNRLSHRARALARVRDEWMPWLRALAAAPAARGPLRPACGDDLLAMMSGFQPAAVLGAGAESGVFSALIERPMPARDLGEKLSLDGRALAVALDACAALGVLVKSDAGVYDVPPELRDALAEGSERSVSAMLRHQLTCLRRWALLAWTLKSGQPGNPGPGPRGSEADLASFIEAMQVVSRAPAPAVVASVCPPGVRCVLDIGGASGTWTRAWLDAAPGAKALLFDLPPVIPMAERRLADLAAAGRVRFHPGNYLVDDLPKGADLAWLSAIAHQHSREENRGIFRRIARALPPGGRLLIRDLVMDESRTRPLRGALFGVNMLVSTAGGGVWTLREFREDLESAGFVDARLVRPDDGMNAVIAAVRGPDPGT